MKIYIAEDLGCVYRLNGDSLEYAPIAKDNTFDVDDFDYVESDLVGDEPVKFLGKDTKLSEVYEIVTKALKTSVEVAR